jgi:predicted DNA-binding transcriptional regulator AlpA
VRSLKQAAAAANISVPTLRRMIREGRGPKTIRLSERRLGVRDRDFLVWLQSRQAVWAPVDIETRRATWPTRPASRGPRGRQAEVGFVYLGASHRGFCKVGYSINPRERSKALNDVVAPERSFEAAPLGARAL